MDPNEILRLLPHRYPFLLVDRVVEVEPGVRLLAFKNITFNEPFFQGHFPGHPVMPGVLILEALAQAAALLAYKSHNLSPEKEVTYLTGIDGARFRRPVVPGDRLDLKVEVVKHRSNFWKQRGEASVNGQRVAEGEFLATVVPRQMMGKRNTPGEGEG